MTYRHVVTWKLDDEDPELCEAQADEIVASLSPIIDKVPSLRALSVRKNELEGRGNWHVALIADFDDLAGFEEYLVHPEHVAAAQAPRSYAIDKAVADFTL